MNLNDLVEGFADEIAGYLIHHDDLVAGELAMTNATDWGVDDRVVESATLEGPARIEFRTWLRLSGDHDDEKAFTGDTVDVTAEGALVEEKGVWRLESATAKDVDTIDPEDEVEEESDECDE